MLSARNEFSEVRFIVLHTIMAEERKHPSAIISVKSDKNGKGKPAEDARVLLMGTSGQNVADIIKEKLDFEETG